MPHWPSDRPESGPPAGRGAGAPGSSGAVLAGLSAAECWGLLGRRSVGRLGVVQGGYPVVVPVNYALHDDRVLVRTAAGATFAAARQHRVSFQVDGVDTPSRSGWSVLVQGFAVEVTPAERELYDELVEAAAEPWAPGARDRLLVVTPVSVTGRRIDREEGGPA